MQASEELDQRRKTPKQKGASSNTALEEENNALKEQVRKFRSHFGSSHFLFKRALCFSCVTTFSGFCLVQVSTTEFVVSHVFSWRVLTMGLKCLSLVNLVHLRITVLPMVPVLASTEWAPVHLMHSTKGQISSFSHQLTQLIESNRD